MVRKIEFGGHVDNLSQLVADYHIPEKKGGFASGWTRGIRNAARWIG
jgi:hypothetical protein